MQAICVEIDQLQRERAELVARAQEIIKKSDELPSDRVAEQRRQLQERINAASAEEKKALDTNMDELSVEYVTAITREHDAKALRPLLAPLESAGEELRAGRDSLDELCTKSRLRLARTLELCVGALFGFWATLACLAARFRRENKHA